MEKAYAFFRTGAGTYASLNFGWTGAVYTDLGVDNVSFIASVPGTGPYNTISAALAANKAIAVLSKGATSWPVVASHAYSILAATTDAGGTMWFTLRSPTGGVIQVTLGQLESDFSAGSIAV